MTATPSKQYEGIQGTPSFEEGMQGQRTPAQEMDEETRKATAMALAVQANPNMTPEEIQRLVDSQQSHNISSALAAAASPSQNRNNAKRVSGRFAGPFRTKSGRTPPVSPIAEGGGTGRAVVALGATGAGGGEGPFMIPQNVSALAADASVSAISSLRQNLSTLRSHLTPSQRSSAPIHLTGIAWKRRGGMGKYSTTGAWERRRIELQGSRLFYYAKDEADKHGVDDDESMAVVAGASPSMEGHAAVAAAAVAEPTSPGPPVPSSSAHGHFEEHAVEGVVVTKRSHWFEGAFHSSSQQGASDDPTAPRGWLDLSKERATVHAAWGHSGAPSPFAISIKVRGETKWKFCFDHHKSQMEWLAALTDVVVQNSVDSYNALLLEAADPSNSHTDTMVKQPPGASGAQQQLWSTEQYNIKSSIMLDRYDGDDEDAFEDVQEHDDIVPSRATRGLDFTSLAEQDRRAQQTALEEAARTWSIPEQNFVRLVVVFNGALAVARASFMTVTSFWYLVAVANAGLFLCSTKDPSWKSVLKFVKTPTAPVEEEVLPGVDVNDTSPTDGSAAGDGPKTAARAAAAGAKTSGFRPIAGTTTVKLKNPTDLPTNAKDELFAGWRQVPGDFLKVRSHGYLVTKEKVESPGELYECIQCDIFESPSRYSDLAPRVRLPEVTFTDNGPKTWKCPDLFIVSFAMPTDPPKLRASDDGGGFTITMYFKMKDDTRAILRRVTADDYDPSTETVEGDPQKSKVNAARLLDEWVRRAPTDPKWFSRFKCVPNAHNLKEIGIPSWIGKYNGKPFLIKRQGITGFLYNHPELSCMEFDISLHPFPYLFKQGIAFMKDTYFKKTLTTFGFVIEGRADDELPECIIGCMQLCYPDPNHAIQAGEWFAGTSRTSF